MTAHPVLTYLGSGRAVAIGGGFGEIDIRSEIAEALAHLIRFHGQARDVDGRGYSVAEHCCRGADAIMQEVRDGLVAPETSARRVTLAFLVHDAHEAITADPPRNFVEMLAAKFAGVSSHRRLIQDAIDEVKHEIDEALGFAPLLDLPDGDKALVDTMDRRMAAAEIACFFVERGLERRIANPAWPVPVPVPALDAELPDAAPLPLGHRLPGDHRCWSPPRAVAEWLMRWKKWSPPGGPERETRDRAASE